MHCTSVQHHACCGSLIDWRNSGCSTHQKLNALVDSEYLRRAHTFSFETRRVSIPMTGIRSRLAYFQLSDAMGSNYSVLKPKKCRAGLLFAYCMPEAHSNF